MPTELSSQTPLGCMTESARGCVSPGSALSVKHLPTFDILVSYSILWVKTIILLWFGAYMEAGVVTALP